MLPTRRISAVPLVCTATYPNDEGNKAVRKLIFSMMATLDGFTAGPDGELDMFGEDFEDDELLGYLADLLRSVDAYLFGRVAYEQLADYWPKAGISPTSTGREVELAELMNTKPKVVVSRTLTDPVWGPAMVIGGALAAEVAAMKAEPGRDLALFAGADAAASLMGLGLVDEYRLMVYPVAVGTGQSPFARVTVPLGLTLVETRTFPTGVVLLRYHPAAAS